MARKSRSKRAVIDDSAVTIHVTPQVIYYLDRLVETGLFGPTRADAAARILSRGIEAQVPTFLTDAIVQLAERLKKDGSREKESVD